MTYGVDCYVSSRSYFSVLILHFMALLCFVQLLPQCVTSESSSEIDSPVELSVLKDGRLGAGPVLQHDSIFVQCRVKPFEKFDLVKLVRQQSPGGNITADQTIVTNGYVEKEFRRVGRYRVIDWSSKDGVGLIRLQITNVQGEDNANIGCRHFSSLGNTTSSFTYLQIHVPVESVRLGYVSHTHSSTVQWINGSHDFIEVQQDDPGVIICRTFVHGFTGQEPEVAIKRDDVDVTSLFIKKVPLIVEDNSVKYPMKRLNFSVDYELILNSTFDSAIVNGSASNVDNVTNWHQRELRCEAKMPQYTAPAVTATVAILSRPVLTCQSTEWTAHIGQTECEIHCQGRMYPPPDTVIWSFLDNVTNQQVVISSNQTTADKYSASESVHIANNKQTTIHFRLSIGRISRDDFHSFQLEVRNRLGYDIVSMQLIQVEAPPTQTTASTQIDISSTHMFHANTTLEDSATSELLFVLTTESHQHTTFATSTTKLVDSKRSDSIDHATRHSGAVTSSANDRLQHASSVSFIIAMLSTSVVHIGITSCAAASMRPLSSLSWLL